MKIKNILKKSSTLVNIVRRCRVVKTKIRRLNLYKTIVINFRTQPFNKAIKFPILIYGKLKIYSLRGKVIIDAPIKTGMIKIGFNSDLFSAPRGPVMFNINGILILKGNVTFSVDTAFDISGHCELLDLAFIGNGAKIRCWKNVHIGRNVRLASECQLFDTNFHYVRNVETGVVHRNAAPVYIGDYCWIGNRTTIMKGTKLPDYTIVAGNTLLNKDYTKQDCFAPMIGGIPGKILSSGNVRVFSLQEENQIELYFNEHSDENIYYSYIGLESPS